MIESHIVKSLTEIVDHLGGFPNAGDFLFRGLPSIHQSIKPSLFYQRNIKTKEAECIQLRLFDGFVRILKEDYDISAEDFKSNSLDMLMVARHFSLASNFVEFTKDYSVGLKFAFDYAIEKKSNAKLWVLKTKFNHYLQCADSNLPNVMQVPDFKGYTVVNPRLLLAKEIETKLAYDRMLIQGSKFIFQPSTWASSPITEKIPAQFWHCFEILSEDIKTISLQVEQKTGNSMSKDLLMRNHDLDKKCKALNNFEKV